MTRAKDPKMRRRILCLGLAWMVVLAACDRGPAPPAPTEDLVPSVVGVVSETATQTPFILENGMTLDPPRGATLRHIKNWPPNQAIDEDIARVGTLLLGGQAADGSWWYQTAGDPMSDGCWAVYGGSFDEGATIQFSSGLIVPKAPDFEVRPSNLTGQAFPGHGGDYICIDADGQARYFQLFRGA